MAPLISTVYIYTFFSCFEQLFLCFTQFDDSTHCLNFVKFHDTASLRTCKAEKGTFSHAMKESNVKDGVNS